MSKWKIYWCIWAILTIVLVVLTAASPVPGGDSFDHLFRIGLTLGFSGFIAFWSGAFWFVFCDNSNAFNGLNDRGENPDQYYGRNCNPWQ